MENKLIVIEGLDGCGKSTQLELLKKNFPQCHFITFPYYQTPSGQIITEYLKGNYPERDVNVSAYTASSFYAVDRYTSFKTDWEKEWSGGIPLISARYVSSNAIYQMAKLPKADWDEFLSWLYDLEFEKFKLPVPAKTIFLDMPIEVSQKLLLKRYNGDEQQKDVHERNVDFMNKCREAALYVADKQNWTMISCSENGQLLDIETIHRELVKQIKETLVCLS